MRIVAYALVTLFWVTLITACVGCSARPSAYDVVLDKASKGDHRIASEWVRCAKQYDQAQCELRLAGR